MRSPGNEEDSPNDDEILEASDEMDDKGSEWPSCTRDERQLNVCCTPVKFSTDSDGTDS